MMSHFAVLDGGGAMKETCMPLDRIVVFAMAIAFFGGLIWLAVKSRRGAGKEGQPPYNREEDSAPQQSREKERRKPNR